jgi:hypothetical protein
MVVKWAVEHGKLDVIKYLMEKMRQLDYPNYKDTVIRATYINYWKARTSCKMCKFEGSKKSNIFTCQKKFGFRNNKTYSKFVVGRCYRE